jgi:GxxExxY protein
MDYPHVVRIEPSAETDQVARSVVYAAMEVHRALGPGFAESVYEGALCEELRHRGVLVERQPVVHIRYLGVIVGDVRLDLLVAGLVIVELKAVPTTHEELHRAQLISYLKATDLSLGLLLNFGGLQMRTGIRRVVLTGHDEPNVDP